MLFSIQTKSSKVSSQNLLISKYLESTEIDNFWDPFFELRKFEIDQKASLECSSKEIWTKHLNNSEYGLVLQQGFQDGGPKLPKHGVRYLIYLIYLRKH